MAEYPQTHVAPTEGLPAWTEPDGSRAPAANLDPGLDVMLLERRGEWAHVRCSNGWEAWVDGRRLVESAPTQTAPTVTTPPPPPAQPGPPSAAWGTPAAAPAAAPRATGGFSIGPGQIVALIGGLLFLIASWLPWIRFEFSGGGSSASESFSAYRIPAHFLLDSQSELGGLSLGTVIAFFGVACIAAALLSGLRSVRFLSLVAGGAPSSSSFSFWSRRSTSPTNCRESSRAATSRCCASARTSPCSVPSHPRSEESSRWC
jgi:hypothetical protein